MNRALVSGTLREADMGFVRDTVLLVGLIGLVLLTEAVGGELLRGLCA